MKHIHSLTVCRPRPAQTFFVSLLNVLGFLQNIFSTIFLLDQIGAKKGQSA